jgi:hypothetical protein
MKRCVVLADDDPIIIDLVKLRLGMAQYHVVSTGDARWRWHASMGRWR